MHHKMVPLVMSLTLAITAFPQGGPKDSAAKPHAARFTVQGMYEETYQGTTDKGSAQGKLVIKFEAARWLTLSTNEVGNAEFSDLPNAPPPAVSGSASYEGRVKGASSGNTYEAMSNFAGTLTGGDVVISVPEYTDTDNAFKVRVDISPKVKGKCSLIEVRDGETGTANGCANGTYFFTASSPMQFDDNEDPGKTPDSASFGIELDIEPTASHGGIGQGSAGDASDYAWRGAVTTGSKEAGFKILLDKTKELPDAYKRGRSTRKLVFMATIIPGEPR